MANNKFIIREANKSDLPYLYDICRKTGANGTDATILLKDPLLIGQYFAAPYLIFSPETCFVVAKDTIPVGYIIGVKDSSEFYNWMEDYWLPILRERYPKDYNAETDLENFLIRMIHTTVNLDAYLKEYPAQLHIDLLPETQGLGLGKELMNTFLQRLKELKIPGIHFGVSKANEKAVKFYQKSGYTILKENADSLVMGMKLN